MKWWVRVVPVPAAWLVRIWGSTWRVQRLGRTDLAPGQPGPTQYLYSVWHRSILMNGFLHRDRGLCVGVSEHADGDLGARISQHLGYVTARGSSTHGSLRLLREILRFARERHRPLGLTPDGPKGPAGVVKPGIVYLASRLRYPIVPIAVGASRAARLRSWDRMIVPAPFSRMVLSYGEPLEIPADLEGAELERWAGILAARHHELDQQVDEELARRKGRTTKVDSSR